MNAPNPRPLLDEVREYLKTYPSSSAKLSRATGVPVHVLRSIRRGSARPHPNNWAQWETHCLVILAHMNVPRLDYTGPVTRKWMSPALLATAPTSLLWMPRHVHQPDA